MKAEIKFTLAHEDFPDLAGVRTVTATVAHDRALTADADDFIEVVREALDEARKNAAGAHLVDYGSFGNDSAYLDRIDAVAAEMRVVSVGMVGDKVRYAVSGDYSQEGDWADSVEAVTEAEAHFQARWTMALNEGATLAPFEDFLDRLYDIEITQCEPEPVSKDEYRDMLRALCAEAAEAGHAGEALDKALAALAKDGHEVEVSSGPRP